MLGRLRERRQRRKDALAARLAVIDAAYGRLDGEDEKGEEGYIFNALDAIADLDSPEGPMIDNAQLVAQLECMLAEQQAQIAYLSEVAAAARQFCELVTTINRASGESVFKVSDPSDHRAAAALNYRYSDLASLLNSAGRPVPPRLSEGTVH